MNTRLRGNLKTSGPRYIALIISVLMLPAMLAIGFERNLVGTLTRHGWGRTLQGVGAALTQLRCGFGGFVIDRRIDTVLQTGGFTGNPRLLNALGEAYPDNLRNGERLQAALDRARMFDCSVPGPAPDESGRYPHLLGFNGEDSGMSSYTILAFSLFGMNVPSMTYAYFVIVFFSLMLFAIAHHQSIEAMVAAGVLSVALYLTVCSVLFNFNFNMPGEFGLRPGIDIKDPRFLGTVAALPLLHIIITWLRREHRMTAVNYALLALQTAILAFAVHVRFPTGWAVLIPIVLWAVTITRREYRPLLRLNSWRSPRSLFVPAIIFVVLCAGNLLVQFSYHPFYAVEGDLARHTFWDGMLESLEYNPAWRTKYGASVNYASGDEMPIAVARIAIAKLPLDEQTRYLQPDGNPTRVAYEGLSKAAFLEILRSDPAFVLETFFKVKPALMLHTHSTMYRSLLAGLNGWHGFAAITALTVLGLLAGCSVSSFRGLCTIGATGLVCTLLASLPNWLVLVNELVMFDSLIWALFVICLVVIGLVAALAKLTFRAYRRYDGSAFLPGQNPDDVIPAHAWGPDD